MTANKSVLSYRLFFLSNALSPFCFFPPKNAKRYYPTHS